jgi:MFS family permease
MMWRNRNLWILMAGEGIAGLGLWFGLIGNLEFLQRQVPSDFLKAVILMAGMFVGVLLGPTAGRVIDTYPKKKILVVTGFFRILATSFMFLALAFDSVWWMIGYTVIIGAAAAFYFPALQALIPRIVREDQLLSANSLHMNIGTTARILGTAAAGVLLLWMSLYTLYLYTLISYVLIWVCTMLLRVDEQPRDAGSTSGSKKVKSGFKDIIPLLKESPVVLMAAALTLVPMFFIAAFNLMVIAVSDLQHDPSIKGLLYTAEGLSFLLGAFLVKRIAKGRNQITLMLGTALLIALAHLSLIFASYKWMSIFSFGLFGLCAGAFYPMAATAFQKLVPKDYHGRFFSFKGMFDRVLFQVIMLTAGLLLDTIGLQRMVWIYAGCSLVICLLFSLRQLRNPVSYRDQTHNTTTL